MQGGMGKNEEAHRPVCLPSGGAWRGGRGNRKGAFGMTISTEDLLNSILESLDRIDHIRAEDIPDMELYMDQVTTLMDNKLKNTTRYPRGDKILTKTMVNNYTKNDLLPPPVKK